MAGGPRGCLQRESARRGDHPCGAGQNGFWRGGEVTLSDPSFETLFHSVSRLESERVAGGPRGCGRSAALNRGSTPTEHSADGAPPQEMRSSRCTRGVSVSDTGWDLRVSKAIEMLPSWL